MRDGDFVKGERAFARLDQNQLGTALEETSCPSAGCHGGIFADAQNNQFSLRIVRVGGCLASSMVCAVMMWREGVGARFTIPQSIILSAAGGDVT